MDSRKENRSCILDIETTSYQPWSGKIICIGIKDTETGKITVFHDDCEEMIILRFLNHFNNEGFDEILGFNVFHDIRYIFGKCLRYHIPASSFFSSKHTDIMMTLKGVRNKNNFNRPGRLDEWSQFLLGENNKIIYKSVKDLYFQGQIEKIIEHNRNDLERTYQLWRRIRKVLY